MYQSRFALHSLESFSDSRLLNSGGKGAEGISIVESPKQFDGGRCVALRVK
jgi:hypothetical protein